MRFIVLTLLAAMVLLSSMAQAKVDRVIIDAGHGGHDKGGSHLTVYEKHLALDTARRLELILEAQGIPVTMVRTRDKFVELDDRARIGNRYRNSLFISIHYNWTSKSSIRGIETYYYHSESYPLAKYVHRGMLAQTGASSRFIKKRGFRVVQATTKNPAILVECGFLSNSTERNRCMKGSYRQSLAEGIAKGVLAYRWVYR